MTTNEVVLLDVESRSRADLKALGGRRYWEHATSEILCVCWHDTRDGARGVWVPGMRWPFEGRTLVAHNAHGFDRFALARYGITALTWIDTSQLARKAGLPGSLDDLGVIWCDTPKDAEGSKYVKSLSRVTRPPEITPKVWRALSDADRERVWAQVDYDRVIGYCHSDVAIMAKAWPRLQEWIAVDAAAQELDREINDRGVGFDVALAKRLLDCDAVNVEAALSRAAAAMGIDVDTVRKMAMSTMQFCAATGAPDARKATRATLDHPLADARAALASIARGKLQAGLARVHSDGRLRDTLLYYGGHTGRWSGRGVQPQNLTRPDPRFEDVDIDALAIEVLQGRHADPQEIDFLLRAVFYAPAGAALAACDFSSIEARATAWAAGDAAALDVFVSGRDPYKVAATAVFGVDYDAVTKPQRQIGKIAELACGYQGGPAAFERFAAVYGIDVSALDLGAIVEAWRTLHAPIKSLWYACGDAFAKACNGSGSYWAGPFEFTRADDGTAVACFLPSGRPIVYQGAEAHPAERGHSLSYRSRKGFVEHVYGGKIVENTVQALCRDLMVHAMILVRDYLPLVLTVHDEIVVEVPEHLGDAALSLLRSAMTDVPAWAAGLPLNASGWTGKRYRK